MNDRNSEYSEAALDTAERGGRYESLASRALNLVAERRMNAQASQIDHHVSALAAAVIDADPSQRETVLNDIRKARFTDDDIAERIIPEVARLLGERWCVDQQSFAEVTIGSARLQGLLRELSPRRDSSELKEADVPTLAVVVAQGETHTLGAMVLARFLRRHGASVRLIVGRPDADLATEIGNGGFDAVLVSVTSGSQVERAKKLVKRLKSASCSQIPLLVGGNAVGERGEDTRFAEADHTVTDPNEALELCGLTTSQRAGNRRETLE